MNKAQHALAVAGAAASLWFLLTMCSNVAQANTCDGGLEVSPCYPPAFDQPHAQVPIPGTLLLLGAGIAALAIKLRK